MNQRGSDKQNAPFENFKGLAKRLLTVPKKEADKEKAAYERKKGGRERPG